MEKCRSYHGNKMKVGDSAIPEVETVQKEDGADDYKHTYFPDIPLDKTTIPEQNVIDNEGNLIIGLDHVVYINYCLLYQLP